MVLAFRCNQKYPFCTLSPQANVMLAQPLRLQILHSTKWKPLSGDRHFYLYARKCNIISEVDGLTREKMIAKFILHSIYKRRTGLVVQATVPSKITTVVF